MKIKRVYEPPVSQGVVIGTRAPLCQSLPMRSADYGTNEFITFTDVDIHDLWD